MSAAQDKHPSKNPALSDEQLAEISSITVAHYDGRAEEFWAGTRDHDVSQNREALLRHIEAEAPLHLLDLGCGPGRDLLAFASMGHRVTGLDGSRRFCEMARRVSGCEVLEQDLLALDLPDRHFDGIFANASLFHVPAQELSRVLSDLHRALKPRGVLFASNPRGDNSEGWSGERYGSYHDYQAWDKLLSACGFEQLEHYYRPQGKPRDQQPWLASVYRKLG